LAIRITLAGLLLLLMANSGFAADSAVIINEIVASNSNGLQDEDGDFSDWIELHNRGAEPVDLDGWSLTDDIARPRQWLFPDVTIGSGQFLVVFASGKNRRPADGSFLHTNFVLDRKGEFLALINRDGHSFPGAIFDPGYVEQNTDQSYGTHATETGYRFYQTPSPGSTNVVSAYLGVTGAPLANFKRGFYDTAISVALTSADLGAKIYFTVDGRDPGPGSGALYTGPIPISSTSVLRARAYRPDLAPSPIETHTYLIKESRAVKSLPVLSIVGDPEQSLYEPNGIMAIVGGYYNSEHLWGPVGPEDYNNPMQRGRDFERPVSMEYLPADGTSDFQIDAGIRVGGSDSHRARYMRRDGNWLDCSFPVGKHSKFTFRMYFRDVYGKAKLRFPLIPEAPVAVFDSLSLRGGLQDWCNPFFKDELVRRLRHDMGGMVALGTMVNLFINGQYKTYINLTERYEEDTLRNWLNTSNGFDILTQRYRARKVTRSGDDAKWLELLDFAENYDLSIPTRYQQFEQMLDIPDFVDYVIAQLYSQNTDWPINNWTAARERRQGAKWRFYLWDAEGAFRSHPDPWTPNSNWTHFNKFPHWRPDFGTGLNGENDAISKIYRALKASPRFRQLFADHIGRHFFNGGALTDENVKKRFHELRDELKQVIPDGDRHIIDKVLPRRRAIVLDASVNEGMFTFEGPRFLINGSRQNGGAIDAGEVLSMSGPIGSGSIYYTLDGTDPLRFDEPFFLPLVTESSTRNLFFPSQKNVAPSGGHALPDTSAFWLMTHGGVGYQRDSAIKATSFERFIDLDIEQWMYGVSSSCFIRIPFELDAGDLARIDTLVLKMRYDDGYIAYINGTEVARGNAPEVIANNSKATSNRIDSEAVMFEAVDISTAIGQLKPGENVLIIHGMNSGSRSADFLIVPELIAYQNSKEMGPSPTAEAYAGQVRLTESVHVKARMKNDRNWSALSEVVFSVSSSADALRITELMYHPPERAAEFVELQNVGNTAIDLTGVRFDDAIDFSFPASVLGPGEIIVLVNDHDLSAFRSLYPDVAVEGTYQRRFNNAGETITLVAADGVTVLESLTYDDTVPWPIAADGSGHSLELLDLTRNANRPDAWRASLEVGGSPGKTRNADL
jgi:hypothetical protein